MPRPGRVSGCLNVFTMLTINIDCHSRTTTMRGKAMLKRPTNRRVLLARSLLNIHRPARLLNILGCTLVVMVYLNIYNAAAGWLVSPAYIFGAESLLLPDRAPYLVVVTLSFDCECGNLNVWRINRMKMEWSATIGSNSASWQWDYLIYIGERIVNCWYELVAVSDPQVLCKHAWRSIYMTPSLRKRRLQRQKGGQLTTSAGARSRVGRMQAEYWVNT